MAIKDGKKYSLVLGHGPTERTHKGTVRVFKDDAGETRYEIAGTIDWDGPQDNQTVHFHRDNMTVGFLLEHVVSATEL